MYRHFYGHLINFIHREAVSYIGIYFLNAYHITEYLIIVQCHACMHIPSYVVFFLFYFFCICCILFFMDVGEKTLYYLI